jgi:hypothetical protein
MFDFGASHNEADTRTTRVFRFCLRPAATRERSSEKAGGGSIPSLATIIQALTEMKN